MLSAVTISETFTAPQAVVHRDQFRQQIKRLSHSVSADSISEAEEEAEEEQQQPMMTGSTEDLNFHSQKSPHLALRACNEGLISKFTN